jgi:hypothetical protein
VINLSGFRNGRRERIEFVPTYVVYQYSQEMGSLNGKFGQFGFFEKSGWTLTHLGINLIERGGGEPDSIRNADQGLNQY